MNVFRSVLFTVTEEAGKEAMETLTVDGVYCEVWVCILPAPCACPTHVSQTLLVCEL